MSGVATVLLLDVWRSVIDILASDSDVEEVPWYALVADTPMIALDLSKESRTVVKALSLTCKAICGFSQPCLFVTL
jgi:hypothetical protein